MTDLSYEVQEVLQVCSLDVITKVTQLLNIKPFHLSPSPFTDQTLRLH